MKRSNRLVILVGVLLAALAFVGIVVVLNQQSAQQEVGPAMEVVLVASDDIAIGEPVTPDRVEAREVPVEAVIQVPLRDPSQVQGQPALFNIPAGTQVTQAAVGLGAGADNLAAQLQTGEKAVSFLVDRVQGLNFLVQPGDTIDIVVTVHLSDVDDPIIRTVKTVLQNKRVLYVSGTNIAAPPTAEPAEGEAAPPPPEISSVVIVFAGTDQDAELIRMAQRTETDRSDGAAATLSITLRTNDDDAIEETTGVTLETLIEDYGVLVPTLDDILLRNAPPEEPTP